MNGLIKFECIILIILLMSCRSEIARKLYLGQGLMSGEVTSHSVILQARITATDTLSEGDVLGVHGVGRFVLDTDSTFQDPQETTNLIYAVSENDFIIKSQIKGLSSGTRYYYKLLYGEDPAQLEESEIASFRTLPGAESEDSVHLVVVTGMNYYHFHFGRYGQVPPYSGSDKYLGYPALESIKDLQPDYFIGTGDNVYFDHPNKSNFDRALEAGRNPNPGRYQGSEVTDQSGMRMKYHEQFVQQRFKDLFGTVATYWEKDDHDYRYNDADPYQDHPISHKLGIEIFKEQLPVVDPDDSNAVTYRTYRMNKDLQIWLVEGRDYRSANESMDGSEKTLWGAAQMSWLKQTLLESTATFKLLISPTPMVGPDDQYKSDNHVNPKGFRTEGEAFFNWLNTHDFLDKNFYIICGDRHWKYHAMHPSGFEEFSCGALVDNNSRAGRLAGDPQSTDTLALIKQFFIEGTTETASGGFLSIRTKRITEGPQVNFRFFDEKGALLYEVSKPASM